MEPQVLQLIHFGRPDADLLVATILRSCEKPVLQLRESRSLRIARSLQILRRELSHSTASVQWQGTELLLSTDEIKIFAPLDVINIGSDFIRWHCHFLLHITLCFIPTFQTYSVRNPDRDITCSRSAVRFTNHTGFLCPLKVPAMTQIRTNISCKLDR